MRWSVPFLATLLMLAGVAPAGAQPAHDPDWPCLQRLVPELSAGMMWSGPPLNASGDGWDSDPELAQLAGQLAARRMPLDQASEAIDEYSEGLSPDARAEKLGALFAGVLELINGERSRTIAGIKSYARHQRQLAERITQENRRLDQLERDPQAGAQTEAADVRTQRDWDLRIYDDRNRALRQVCDQPVQLEQRAFALARAIQNRIE
jgi:hypothetical protein